MNKKFIYGIAAVMFGKSTIGYIEKNSWNWNGSKPEKVDVEAEQVPAVPVLTLITKNGTIAPTFNLIQLDYENLKLALGGTLVGSEGNYTGWKAPSSLVELRDSCTIQFVSGQTMNIKSATLMANLGGNLTLTAVSKLECQLTVNAAADGSEPYEIVDTATAAQASEPAAQTEGGATEQPGTEEPGAEQ